MNALKTLNKEQWTAAIGVVVGGLMLLTGVAGGLAVQSEIPQPGAEIRYEKLPTRYVELPDEKFERYWKKDLGTSSPATRLPVPYLRAPEPREEDLAAPLFRPAPATEAYNKAPAKVKYPVLTPGAALIPEAQLLPPAEVQALAKLAEPEIQAKPDRRAEQERPFAILTHVSGKKYEGKLVADSQGVVRFKVGNATLTFNKAEIKELLGDETFEELYRKESKAIPPGPKGAEARIKLARKLLDWGMGREAREELALALEAKADSLDAVLLAVQLMIEASDFEGALAALDAAEESGAADVYYEKGRILRLLGLHEGAVNAFDRAVEISPRHAAARIGLARAHLDAGRSAEAEAAANNFIVKMGGLSDVPVRLKAEAHAVRGIAALRAGQIEKAKADAAESLKLDAQGAEAANLLGAALAFDGQWQAAAAEFAKAVRADQYLTDAWTNLATLSLLAGKWADAEALYAAAAQRDPASAEAAGGVGAAQLLSGKAKEAAASLDKALAIDPRHLPTLLAQGQMHLALGADDVALGRFREALVADPYSLPAYAGAAAAYLRTARVIAAQADAVKMDETRAAPLFKQAGERRVNAETLLRTLKDFDPNRPGAWTALGCAYAGMSRPEDARQALRMAASLLQQAGRPVDPLIFYALGYVEYYFGEGDEEVRMNAGLDQFQQGEKARETHKDPFSVRVASECDGVVAAIEEWKVTSVRFDDRFEGEPGKTLGAQWIEVDDKYGVAVTLEKPASGAGRAKLSGRQSIADYGVTMMSREIPSANFLSFEATLFPEKTEKAEFGMSLYYNEAGGSRTGFHVGVDGQGRLRFNPTAREPQDMDRKDMVLGWQELKTAIPNPAEIRIRITKTEKNKASFLTISIWDGAKGQWIPAHREIPFNMAQAKAEWRAGLFIRAPKELDVTLWADNLRVYERLR